MLEFAFSLFQGNSPIKSDAENDSEKLSSLKMEPNFKRKLAQQYGHLHFYVEFFSS